MTRDLFSTNAESWPAGEMPGAELRFVEDFLAPRTAEEHLQSLLIETPWREANVFVWGKWHKQPRLIQWYGDEGASYAYSGSTLNPLAWTPRLMELRRMVELRCGTKFNSVLLNLYRDGNDSMGWHSDNEPELGQRPIIGSLSLGATRELLFKHRANKTLGTRRVALTNGSLLIMSGDTQENWLHSINKERNNGAKRINLTFRLIAPSGRRTKQNSDSTSDPTPATPRAANL